MRLWRGGFLFWHQSGYFDTASELKPLLHTWSLAVEEQYYVLFPILIVSTWKFGKRWIFLSLLVISILSFGLAEWTSRTYPGFDFFMLPTRSWEILLGAFTAFYLNRKNRKVLHHSVDQLISLVGLSLVIYAVYAFNDQTPFPGIYALIPTVGATFIILCATNQTLVGRLLGSQVIVGIGLISYSAYLWHQPILAFARQRSLDQPSNQLLVGLALATGVFSYISWRFIEKPFRNKKIISRQKIFLYGVIGSLFFIVAGLVGYGSGGFPFRFDSILLDLQKANMGAYESHVKPCWSKIENSPTLESACSFGANKPPSFALLGDSHSGALLAELDTLGSAHGVGGVNYSYRSCPPLTTVDPIKATDGDRTCSALRKNFFDGITFNSVIPQTIVISARWAALVEKKRFDNEEGGVELGDEWIWNFDISGSTYSKAVEINLINSIHSMLDSGRRVVLIYPIPEMGWDVPSRLSKIYRVNHSISPPDASTSYSRFLERNKKAYDALDAIGHHQNLIRIKPENILCNTYVKERCIAQLNGVSLYYDNNHLSDAGALLIASQIIEAVQGPIR